MNLDGLNFSIKADKLFFIITGQKNIIETFINLLNKDNFVEKYIMTKINCPSALRSIELMKELNDVENENMLDSYTQKPILIDDGVEFAQGYVNAEGEYNDNFYIIQTLLNNESHYILSFLKFILEEDDNPETVIENWFKKKMGKIPQSVKKSIKLITVAGPKSNILVISAELKKI